MRTKKILFLDDSLERTMVFKKNIDKYLEITLFLCNNAADAFNILCKQKLDIISLDHDLGTEPINGTSLSKTSKLWISTDLIVILHSVNPDGRHNMENIIYQNRPNFIIYSIPFIDKIKYWGTFDLLLNL